ncbi:hypothetical protein CBL_05726 [Carabus blaptoides fortunei]
MIASVNIVLAALRNTTCALFKRRDCHREQRVSNICFEWIIKTNEKCVIKLKIKITYIPSSQINED